MKNEMCSEIQRTAVSKPPGSARKMWAHGASPMPAAHRQFQVSVHFEISLQAGDLLVYRLSTTD